MRRLLTALEPLDSRRTVAQEPSDSRMAALEPSAVVGWPLGNCRMAAWEPSLICLEGVSGDHWGAWPRRSCQSVSAAYCVPNPLDPTLKSSFCDRGRPKTGLGVADVPRICLIQR